MLTYSQVAALAAVILGSPTVAQAERALTLDEVLTLARQNNRDLAVARARLDEARVGVEQARAALLPTAAASGSYTRNYKQDSLDLPPAFGFPSPVVVLQQNALQGGLSVSVPLVAPAAYPALSAAGQTFDAARKTFDVSETSILFNAAQAFFLAAGADELLQARHHAVEVARVTMNNASARLLAGTVNRTEVTRAELALLNAEQAERTADDTRVQTYRSLVTILALREAIHVVPPDPGKLPPSDPAVETLTSQALHLRPEIGAYEANIRAAEGQANAALWRWAPTLSASGSANLYNYAGFTGDKYSWGVGALLSWTLYDGGLRDASRHQANAQRIENEAQLSLLHDTIGDDIANAERSLATKRVALTTAQRSVSLASETLDLLRAQYGAGTSTELDVLQAQDSLINAEVTQAQARFDLSLADLTLKRVSGTFPNGSAAP